ncbi:uncharacterized protein LOC130732092 [Lotus japonicus]|uniref:uncharacterized protein LOC130732092 n=1 Tax=Lotus japonicus TaxID=34305 RepID=UPI00258F1E73|nr:uncharacterized protein LOC130732092 [Lotus japonicus]
MIRGREGKAAAPSTDLLVCFPARAHHLSLMPKPICSPARPSEPNKRHHHRRKSSISRGGGGGGAQASPLLWAKTKPMGSENSEPTSPKVTCAGQIKVRPKSTTACRSWQSVMEEIEKIHNDKKQRKRLSWAETLGFKKEIMQFLTCLRSIRFDLRCFGSFPGTDVATEEDDDDDDDDEDHDEDEVCHENIVGVEESESEASKTAFSKWFMVLQEDQNKGFHMKEETEDCNDDGSIGGVPSVPPPNALLLMRCRSAPAKSWLRESERDHENHEKEENPHSKEKEKGKVQEHVKKGQSLKSLMMMEEESTRKDQNLVVMRYNPEFYDISSDIAKETWIVGGIRDLLARSRSSKR